MFLVFICKVIQNEMGLNVAFQKKLFQFEESKIRVFGVEKCEISPPAMFFVDSSIEDNSV